MHVCVPFQPLHGQLCMISLVFKRSRVPECACVPALAQCVRVHLDAFMNNLLWCVAEGFAVL